MNHHKIFFILLLFYFSCGSGLIFFPGKNIAATPERLGYTYEDIYFNSGDGIKLNGWWIPSKSPGRTVLFSHGNAGNISHRMDSIRIFNELGLNVFIYDYRGYGLSGGSPSEAGVYIDAEAAWDYLVSVRGIAPDKIIVFGRSLGGSIAANLAGKHLPAMLIIESSFTSAADVAGDLYPFVPTSIIFGKSFNTLEFIKKVRCPVLVIHSRDDEVVPFPHGEKIYKSLPGEKYFLELEGGHNSGFMVSREKYIDGLRKFIDGKKLF